MILTPFFFKYASGSSTRVVKVAEKDVCAAEWRCEDAIGVVVGGLVVKINCVEYNFGVFMWSKFSGKSGTKLDSWLFLF